MLCDYEIQNVLLHSYFHYPIKQTVLGVNRPKPSVNCVVPLIYSQEYRVGLPGQLGKSNVCATARPGLPLLQPRQSGRLRLA